MPMKNVHVTKLTLEEADHILSRLHFWSGVFYDRAETLALPQQLSDLTKGLTEKRFVTIKPESLETFERQLLYETDPVMLWRVAMALQNHKLGLLQRVVKRFPGQKEKLKRFRLVRS